MGGTGWYPQVTIPEKEGGTERKTNLTLPSYVCGMCCSRAWCVTPPILGVVNMVGTRTFTCYMGAL